MQRGLGAAMAGALALLIASNASGDELGADEVSLKNGGTVRGTVVSVEPGSSVVILEAGQREPRRLLWSEVADVQRGKFAAASSPPAPSADEDEEDEPKRVKVHIDSPEPVSLDEVAGTQVIVYGGRVGAITSSRTVCSAPCNRRIEPRPGRVYFVQGEGVTPSSRFEIPPTSAGQVTIGVKPGSSGLRWGGMFMLVTGVTLLVGGAVMAPLGYVVEQEPFAIAGFVGLGVGAGLLGGGIGMIVASTTRVRVVDGAPRKSALADPDAFEIDRRPTAVPARWYLGEF